MSSIKLGQGGFDSSLLNLPFNDFMRVVQANKGFRGDIMTAILTKLWKKANPNETPRITETITTTPEREVKSNSGGGSKKKRG